MRVVGPRRHAGICLESTGDDRYGVLPGEERLVRKVMTQDVVTVDARTTVKQAAEIMQFRNVPALVVYRNEDIAGVVTERELALKGTTRSAHPSALTVQDMLAGCEPVGCREDAILGRHSRHD
jgi:CBS domain-containing protein